MLNAAIGTERAVSGLLPRTDSSQEQAVVVLNEGRAAAVAAATDAFQKGAFGRGVEAKFQPAGINFVNAIGGPAQ